MDSNINPAENFKTDNGSKNDLSNEPQQNFTPVIRVNHLPAKNPPRFLVSIVGLILAIVLLSGTESVFNSLIDQSLRGLARMNNELSELNQKTLSLVANVESSTQNQFNHVNTEYERLFLAFSNNLNRSYQDSKQSLIMVKNDWLQLQAIVTDYNHNLQTNLTASTLFFWHNTSLGAKNVARIYSWSNQSVKNKSLALTINLSQSFEGVKSQIETISQSLLDDLYYYANVVADNWRNWLAGTDHQEPVWPVINEEALRERIKVEILAELGTELEAVIKDNTKTEPTLITNKTGQGIVVVPNDGNRTDDQIKTKIRSMFSDEVKIDFDTSGQSGIITPIFRDITGESYVFVLTPINK